MATGPALEMSDRQSEKRTPHVLVVDDEPSLRLLLRVNLELAGFRVDEARGGAEALQLVRSGPYDLVLLDVMLPDVGGYDVVRTLTEAGADAPPVVFLSARASAEDQRQGLEAGAIDFVTKPFDPEALTARVWENLERLDRGEAAAYRAARLA